MPRYPLEPINTTQLPECQPYTDKYGMMQDNPEGNSTGNGNLFTAHLVFALFTLGIISEQERARLYQVFKNNFREPGLLLRAPGYYFYQAHDDIIGLVSAESFLSPQNRQLTNQIYEYGRDTYCDGVDQKESDPPKILLNKRAYTILSFLFGKIRWVWNTECPKKFHVSSWLGRHLNFIATLQMASKRTVNPICWLYWAITMLQIVLFPNKEHLDGYTLRFHSAIACQNYGFLTNLICKAVRKAIKRDFGGLGQLLGKYFNNPEHPLAHLLKDVS